MRAQALLGLFAISSQAFVSATSISDPLDGYEIETPSWEFSITEGSPPVVLNGTIEAVIAQLKEEYPDFAAEVLKSIEAAEDDDEITNDGDSTLSKRQHFNECFNQPSVATTALIEQGIRNLRGRPGRPSVGANRCNIASCSNGAGILWCNDNTHSVSLNSWDDVANAARVLVNQCSMTISGIRVTYGQRFHGNRQNVVVRGGVQCFN
ncbi:hypothetical protein S40288_07979 [Stachybotrys chartarum IBT 40288]|nr:hypothetical protein S40288_07979 [Stachybotrys chartarum IBT 40288]